MKRYLILFQSTRAVLKAERLMKKHRMHATIIPVPRSISSECGMALEVAAEDREEVERLCSREGIDTTLYIWER